MSATNTIERPDYTDPQSRAWDRIIRDAGTSQDGKYRYWLTRSWSPLDHGLPVAGYSKEYAKLPIVMLNPSTADAWHDDPTIRRCMGFAKSWGWGGIQVVNLFAWRATDPIDVVTAKARGEDVVGPLNDKFIANMVRHASLTMGGEACVLCAWGAHPLAAERAPAVREIIGADAYCVGTTASGAPRHPLYVPNRQELVKL